MTPEGEKREQVIARLIEEGKTREQAWETMRLAEASRDRAPTEVDMRQALEDEGE